jgi:hypothetical protein
VFLPEDKKGRSVLCYDASRTEGASIGALLGVMFYSALLCTQNNVSRFEGVVLLVPVSHMTSPDQLAQIQEIVQVFPFTWHAIHIISTSPEPHLMKCCAPKAIGHTVISNKEILKELASHGMLKSGLPESLGGDWCYSQHALWQEQRIRIEWDLPSLCSTFESNGKLSYNLTEEEKAERKRRYNVLHAKRKRHRDKVEVEVLKKQVEDLQLINLRSTRERDRLENLIEDAHFEVARANETFESSHGAVPAAAAGGIGNLTDAHAGHMLANQQMDLDEILPLAVKTAVNSASLPINFDVVDVGRNPFEQSDPVGYEATVAMASGYMDQRQAQAWADFSVPANQAATLNSSSFPGLAGPYVHPERFELQLPFPLTGGQAPSNPGEYNHVGHVATDDLVAHVERQQLLRQQQLNSLQQQQRHFSQFQAEPTGFAQGGTAVNTALSTSQNPSTTSYNDEWEALVRQLASMSNGAESMDCSYRQAP